VLFRSSSSKETAPTGTPERRLEASASASWSPSARLSLGLLLGGVLILDAGHVEGKTELGAEAGVSAKFTL
jgi:hypothetical protein